MLKSWRMLLVVLVSCTNSVHSGEGPKQAGMVSVFRDDLTRTRLTCDRRPALLLPLIVKAKVSLSPPNIRVLISFDLRGLTLSPASNARRSSRATDFGVGRMLNGTGRVDPCRMYSM